jgi:hypothetical protein
LAAKSTVGPVVGEERSKKKKEGIEMSISLKKKE